MASDLDFVEYACDQLGGAGRITYRKMFGEAAEAPPYPGAKLHFLIDEGLDDREFLARLIHATWAELPEPKPKKPKAPKPKR